MKGVVRTEIIKNHVGVITVDHPPINDLPGYLLADLAAAIQRMGQSKEVKVILLKTGGNRVFCAGASFEEMMALNGKEKAKKFFMGFAHVIQALRYCGKITIARVHGKVVGGGLGLCSAVDFAVANRWASIRLSELDLGIGPFVIGPAVVRKIGVSAFEALALNPGEWKSPSWAHSRGLFHEVRDETDEMDAFLDEMTARFVGYSLPALEEIKQMLWYGVADWAELMEERAATSARLVLGDHAQRRLREEKEKMKS